jgi:hypothetical protein
MGPATANKEDARARSRAGTRSGATASRDAGDRALLSQQRGEDQRQRGHAGEPRRAAPEPAARGVRRGADRDQSGDPGGGANHCQRRHVGHLRGGVDRLDAIGNQNRLNALETGVERNRGGRQQGQDASGGGHAGFLNDANAARHRASPETCA